MSAFTVGGVEMKLPIMPGGGVCKFAHQLEPYLRDDLLCGALEIGSITPPPREGNPGSPQWPEGYEALRKYRAAANCWNMPNAGTEETAEALSRIQSPLPIIVNVAGFAPEDFANGVMAFDKIPQVAATVSNYGCPNAEKIPIAYDLRSMAANRKAVRDTNPTKPNWEKLSPYITKEERDQLIELFLPLRVDLSEVPVAPEGFLEEVLGPILDYQDIVKAIIIANTLGNVRIFDPKTGEPVITVNDGKGGLSGDILREAITLPLVKRAVAFLEGRIDVIACGGIFEGKHVLEYLEAGARGVQCVSGPTWDGGPRFFNNLITDSPELQDYLIQHME